MKLYKLTSNLGDWEAVYTIIVAAKSHKKAKEMHPQLINKHLDIYCVISELIGDNPSAKEGDILFTNYKEK